jgi:hypothetical protein
MATETRVASDRLKAQKGGVRWTQAKLAVSLEAVSNGIFAKEILIYHEDADLLSHRRINLSNLFLRSKKGFEKPQRQTHHNFSLRIWLFLPG